MLAQISIDCIQPSVISEDEAKESKAWWIFYLIRIHHTIREIAEIVGLNNSTEQDIRAKIDNYGSPFLTSKQVVH